MSRQGAGTSVPAPLAYPAACWAGLLGVPCWAGLLGVPCWAGLLCAPVGGGPPASRPRHELRSARRLEARPGPAAAHRHRGRSLRHPPAPSTPVVPGVLIGAAHRLEARPGPAAAHRHRGRSLRHPPHQWRLVADVWLGALAAWMCCLVPAISHVIPLGIFQTMNSYRWYCNVLGRSQKMTEGNYVRLLVSAGPPAAFCPAVGPASRSPPVPFFGVRVVERKLCSG